MLIATFKGTKQSVVDYTCSSVVKDRVISRNTFESTKVLPYVGPIYLFPEVRVFYYFRNYNRCTFVRKYLRTKVRRYLSTLATNEGTKVLSYFRTNNEGTYRYLP